MLHTVLDFELFLLFPATEENGGPNQKVPDPEQSDFCGAE